MRRIGGIVVCLVALLGATIASARTARPLRTYSTPLTRPLQTALMDTDLFTGVQQTQAFAVAHHAGARYARVMINWARVAPTSPDPSFDPADPNSVGYDWSRLDALVENAATAGLTPILDITHAPGWAYAVRPKGVNGGTPDVTALKHFAQALAVHFDGSGTAPAEHLFQVWNEPNLSLDLSPVNPGVYRSMVNAVASSVHGVNQRNVVVAGGLDPFGHSKTKTQKWYSVTPLSFMRSLLCLSKGSHPHSTCKARIHFDVWAHHPYTFGGPFGHARVADDVSLGDLPKMRSLLQAGKRLHRVVSSRPVQFWVTEFAWDTNPPRHNALKIPLQARATSESLYQMWRSGVSLATWYLLQDTPGKSPYKSGLYFAGRPIATARAKPTLTAFRFPFVAYLGRGTVSLWGRSATDAKASVTIERRHGIRGRWRPVARVVANRYGIFQAKLRLAATPKDWLRATAAGSGNSLAFSLTQPKYPHVGPWGN
jgi:hypothetical protein